MTRIELLGTSFQIQSDESPEYLQKLLNHFGNRIDEIEQSVATGDPLKKAILAALLVTDELFRSETRTENSPNTAAAPSAEIEEIGAITERIIRQIDQVLPAE